MRRGTVVLLLLLISAAYTARATSVVNDDDDDPFDDFFEDESDDDARVRQQWAASVEEVATRQTARPSASHDLPEEERVLHESDGIAKFFAAAHYRQRRHRFTTLAVECDPTNPCSGHGRCTTGSLCTCDHDAQKGFWSGPQCQDCDVGYAGPECKKQCAGGSCNVCNTHGICNMGTGGDASCSCYNSNAQGHWTGAECSQCSPGWFGTECTKSCPGTDVGPACYGRGRCNDQDDGSCVCDPGWGSGSGCRECDEAHWGRGCLNSCAGTRSDGVTPCSGHGRCFNGTTGNGTCQCFSGSHYGTATCGVKCPDDCSGFGICREGADRDATCDCFGNRAPPNCKDCLPGRIGPSCQLNCPLNPSTLQICSNRGNCSYSPTLLTAYCKCAPGYGSSLCEVECEGSPPCSGHGTCDWALGVNPMCVCFSDPVRGYWTGPTCGQCQAMYNNSAGCTKACPNSTGVACSGHGMCSNGVCFCERSPLSSGTEYCGPACERSSKRDAASSSSTACLPGACSCVYCSKLFAYGVDCGRDCPGTSVDGLMTCSGHGWCGQGNSLTCRDAAADPPCAAGQINTGECSCMPGYVGLDCSQNCGARNCGSPGRGYCVLNDLTPECECYDMFAGANCELSCPAVAGMMCAGHGQCNNTRLGDASCKCSGGFTGASCDIPCACNPQNGACDVQLCQNYTTYQTCSVCRCFGNFSEAALCNDCVNGTQGERCEGPCVHGITRGRQCLCQTNWSTPACNVSCPRDPNSGYVCGGHGACRWGNDQSGNCVCDDDWYGSYCSSYCTLSLCTATLINPQCNVESGACVCQDSAQGHWNGTRCDACRDGFWGPTCTEECHCSSHGSCDINTGECRCFESQDIGFYTGQQCDTCAEGYIGEKCERRNVLITRVQRNISNPDLPVYPPPAYPADTLPRPNLLTVDERFGYVYAGFPMTQLDVSGVDVQYVSSLLRASSAGPTPAPGANETHCDVPEVYLSWFQDTVHFMLLQPTPNCPEAAFVRILKMSRSVALGQVPALDKVWTALATDEFRSYRIIGASVVSNPALVSEDPTGSGAHGIAILLAAPPLAGAATETGGGYMIFIDDLSGRVLVASQALDRDFVPKDIAMSPFFEIAIAGYLLSITDNRGNWEIQGYKRVNGETRSLLDSTSYTLRSELPCWPYQLTGGTGSGACTFCGKVDKILFTDRNLVAAIRTSQETIIAHILSPLQVTGTFFADIAGRCFLARVEAVSQATRVVQSVDTSSRRGKVPQFVVVAARTDETDSVATAMAVDPMAKVVYVCLSLAKVNRPSVLAKFQLGADFTVYGKRQLNYVSTAARTIVPEAFTSMGIDRTARLLYGLVADVSTLRVVTLLLYEVHQLEPNVADQRGGTVINVTGLGFQQLINQATRLSRFVPKCIFGGRDYVDADIVSPGMLRCRAPPVDNLTSAVGSCDGQNVEVTLYADRWNTDNLVSVKRIQSARIDSVSPDRGGFGGENVTVSGQGFVESQYALCKFFTNNTQRPVPPLFAAMEFISPNRVLCRQPVLPSATARAFPETSLIDISLDGQLYCETGPSQYQIVGSATNLSAPSSIVVDAADTSRFSIVVSVIDDENHELLSLDPIEREVCLDFRAIRQSPCDPVSFESWRSNVDGYPFPPCRNNTVNYTSGLPDNDWCGVTNNGRIEFKDIVMYQPRRGDMVLPFRPKNLESWTRYVTLQVHEGVGYALMIANRKEMTLPITDGQALSPPPEIIVIDKLGNVLSFPGTIVIKATTYYVLDGTTQQVLGNPYFLTQRQDGSKIRFSQVFLKFVHGANHYINFTADSSLLPTTSPAIRTAICEGPERHYKVANSSSCKECPEPGGECTGTEVIKVKAGYWRAPNVSTTIYQCFAGAQVCLGSPNMTGSACALGYRGELCALCENGWGHAGATQCVQCEALGQNIALIVLGTVVVLAILLGWTITTLRTAETTDASVILRTVVNHMQATGKLGEFSAKWHPFLKGAFQVESSASSLSFSGVASMDCILRYYGQDYSLIFIIYMMLPVMSLVMAVGVFAVVRSLKLRPVISKKLEEEIAEERKNFPGSKLVNLEREYPLYMILITTFCVSMFTLYQTLITQSTSVLQCKDVETAPGQVEHFLLVDFSIKCTSSNDHPFRTAAYLCAIGYGFGIPISFVFGYKLLNGRIAKPELTKLMFMFLIGGYKEKYWFWQAVIMIRKMILVLIIVFIGNNTKLQSYCGMWVMSIALVMQIWFQPCEKDEHNLVEALSLAIITVTLNLGLLYFWPGIEGNELSSLLLTSALLIITLGATFMFAYFLYEPIKDLVRQKVDMVFETINDIRKKAALVAGQNQKVLRFDQNDDSAGVNATNSGDVELVDINRNLESVKELPVHTVSAKGQLTNLGGARRGMMSRRGAGWQEDGGGDGNFDAGDGGGVVASRRAMDGRSAQAAPSRRNLHSHEDML